MFNNYGDENMEPSPSKSRRKAFLEGAVGNGTVNSCQILVNNIFTQNSTPVFNLTFFIVGRQF